MCAGLMQKEGPKQTSSSLGSPALLGWNSIIAVDCFYAARPGPPVYTNVWELDGQRIHAGIPLPNLWLHLSDYGKTPNV